MFGKICETTDRLLDSSRDYLYLVFRLIISILFFLHGLVKFGFLGGKLVPTFSLFWFAGIIEIIVGLTLFLGLFARYFAILGAVEMLFAYFYVHLPQGLNPLMTYGNNGELALLYFSAFLIIAIHGNGIFSLEKSFRK